MDVPEVRVRSDAWCHAVDDSTLINGQRPTRLQESVQTIQHRRTSKQHTKKIFKCCANVYMLLLPGHAG